MKEKVGTWYTERLQNLFTICRPPATVPFKETGCFFAMEHGPENEGKITNLAIRITVTVTKILKEANGKTRYFHRKIMFTLKVYKWCWNDICSIKTWYLKKNTKENHQSCVRAERTFSWHCHVLTNSDFCCLHSRLNGFIFIEVLQIQHL